MIPNCKDPSLTMLRSKGYSVVQLPKSDLLPTQLLARNGKKLQRIGDLTSVFVTGEAPPPPISAENPSASISGARSADIDIGIGLNILGGLIASLGGSTLALNVGYAKASSVQFEFVDCRENNAQPALLDQFFSTARVNPNARAIGEMLEADDVYVITSTIKTNKLKVSAKDQAKASLGVDVPVLQQAIGGSLKVSAGDAGNSLLTFEGQVPLVFGFQAIRLIFDSGRYRTMKLVDAGALAIEAPALGDGAESEAYDLLTDTSLRTNNL